MIAMRTLLHSFAAVGAIVLAGCAGAGSPPPSGAPVGFSDASPTGHSVLPSTCRGHDVSVSPCKVTLTTSNPSQYVTVKAPSGSVISVKDDRCSGNMIATVTGTGSTWLVTAGTTAGQCDARFIANRANGRRIGHAVLEITNNG
ncbi:MAG: hypothetical protein WB609_01065 [Candidatus Cybelea sp.]